MKVKDYKRGVKASLRWTYAHRHESPDMHWKVRHYVADLRRLRRLDPSELERDALSPTAEKYLSWARLRGKHGLRMAGKYEEKYARELLAGGVVEEGPSRDDHVYDHLVFADPLTEKEKRAEERCGEQIAAGARSPGQ